MEVGWTPLGTQNLSFKTGWMDQWEEQMNSF